MCLTCPTYPARTVSPRLARHCYDTHRLAIRPVKDSALADLDLLEDVVVFKDRFYRCSWGGTNTRGSG